MSQRLILLVRLSDACLRDGEE